MLERIFRKSVTLSWMTLKYNIIHSSFFGSTKEHYNHCKPLYHERKKSGQVNYPQFVRLLVNYDHLLKEKKWPGQVATSVFNAWESFI